MTTTVQALEPAVTAAPVAQQTLAQQQAAGLRKLADMIEQNPQIAQWLSHSFGYSGINAHLPEGSDKAVLQAEFARIARRHGATTTKDISGSFHNLIADLGAVKVEVVAYREEVCERVVTGTREVVEEVPDPVALAAVPTTTVTTVVEDVEWVCRPLLEVSSVTKGDGTDV